MTETFRLMISMPASKVGGRRVGCGDGVWAGTGRAGRKSRSEPPRRARAKSATRRMAWSAARGGAPRLHAGPRYRHLHLPVLHGGQGQVAQPVLALELRGQAQERGTEAHDREQRLPAATRIPRQGRQRVFVIGDTDLPVAA